MKSTCQRSRPVLYPHNISLVVSPFYLSNQRVTQVVHIIHRGGLLNWAGIPHEAMTPSHPLSVNDDSGMCTCAYQGAMCGLRVCQSASPQESTLPHKTLIGRGVRTRCCILSSLQTVTMQCTCQSRITWRCDSLCQHAGTNRHVIQQWTAGSGTDHGNLNN